jgi:hypothetical protein
MYASEQLCSPAIGSQGHAVPDAVNVLGVEFQFLGIPVDRLQLKRPAQLFANRLGHIDIEPYDFILVVAISHRGEAVVQTEDKGAAFLCIQVVQRLGIRLNRVMSLPNQVSDIFAKVPSAAKTLSAALTTSRVGSPFRKPMPYSSAAKEPSKMTKPGFSSAGVFPGLLAVLHPASQIQETAARANDMIRIDFFM